MDVTVTTPARPKAVAPLTPAEKIAARDAARADSTRIIERYQAREPVSRIAADYHVTPNWLALRLAEWGVPRRHRHEAHALRRPAGHVFRGRTRRRSTAEVRAAQAQFTGDQADVTARYLAGTSITTLAREYQVNPVWVTERLDDWNVPRRKQSAAAAAARARSAR
ncbi:hypothetical protein ACIQOU_14955 [Streptomyces sp. NPDC091279]|uniref:hypothetical protein n=1 Tax=Streptomyces sp. NPDC091279 TaxID=3365983 RepID=UPI00382261CD